MDCQTESLPALNDVASRESMSRLYNGLPRMAVLTLLVIVGAIGAFAGCTREHADPTLGGKPAEKKAAETTPLAPQDSPGTVPSPTEDTPPPFPNLPEELPKETAVLLEELVQVTDYLRQCAPNRPDSLEISARTQLWLGNTEEAVNLWESCLELDPLYGHAYLGLGRVAAKKGDYEAAGKFLRKSLEMSPASPDALVALGDALINAGEIEEAITLLEASPGPPSAARESLLGQACLQTQDYEAARTHYEQAVNLDPHLSDAHYGLAIVSGRQGKTDESSEHMAAFQELRTKERGLRTAGKRGYDDTEAIRWDVAARYTDIGALLFSSRLYPQAERVWIRAAKLCPNDQKCRQALAWLYRQANHPEDAIRMLEQLAELDPTGPQYPLEIGRIRAELGDFDAADEMFRRVREMAPRHPDGYSATARLYVDTGRNLPEAVTFARKTVALEPLASNYALLSEVYELNGDREKSVVAIKQAMELAPEQSSFRKRHQRLTLER